MAAPILMTLTGRGLPPVEAPSSIEAPSSMEDWHPLHCGESLMRIAPDGTWFHEGAPIGRKELVRLFSTLLRKDDTGFVLVTPAEKLSILVEDAPFIAVLLEVEGAGTGQQLHFTTNVGDVVTAGADNALHFKTVDEAPLPYLHVRRGLTAKAARPVYYQLADLAVMHQDRLGVWSGGTFFGFGS
jgi:hypothetical protein